MEAALDEERRRALDAQATPQPLHPIIIDISRISGFYLAAKARIWPLLSGMCHVRWAAVGITQLVAQGTSRTCRESREEEYEEEGGLWVLGVRRRGAARA